VPPPAPPPDGAAAAFGMVVSMTSYDEYVGRLCTGRVLAGGVRRGRVCH
jgi:predicted membrane GTPase involved in stress response